MLFRSRNGNDSKRKCLIMSINRKIHNYVMSDETRRKGSVINSKDRNGYLFSSSWKRMTSRKGIRNARSGSTAINKSESFNRFTIRKTKSNGDKEVFGV